MLNPTTGKELYKLIYKHTIDSARRGFSVIDIQKSIIDGIQFEDDFTPKEKFDFYIQVEFVIEHIYNKYKQNNPS